MANTIRQTVGQSCHNPTNGSTSAFGEYIYPSSSSIVRPTWLHATSLDGISLMGLQECHRTQLGLKGPVIKECSIVLVRASPPLIVSLPYQSHRCYPVLPQALFEPAYCHSNRSFCSSSEPGAGALSRQPWSGLQWTACQSIGG